MKLHFFLLILLIIISIICVIFYNSQDTITEYSTYDEVMKTIDESYFFERMSQRDLAARNCSSKEEYKELYKKNVINFTKHEKNELRRLVKKANVLLENYKISSIKWKFCKINPIIEWNYPHTVGQIIMLPYIPNIQTLIHEKLHVYQRLYPIETSILIHDFWGYSIKDKIENIPNARNNPDTNSFVYGKGDFKIAQIYEEDLDKSNAYIINNGEKILATAQELGVPMSVKQLEHCYEIMACIIPQILLNIVSKDSIKFVYDTTVWMNKYL